MSRDKESSMPEQEEPPVVVKRYASSNVPKTMITLFDIENRIAKIAKVSPDTSYERQTERELLEAINNSPDGSIKRLKLLKKNASFQLSRGYISTSQGNCDLAMAINSEDPDIFLLYALIENAKARREIIMNNEGNMETYIGKALNAFDKFEHLYHSLVHSSDGIDKIMNYSTLSNSDRCCLYYMGLASNYAAIGRNEVALKFYYSAKANSRSLHSNMFLEKIYKQNRFIADFFIEKHNIEGLEHEKKRAQYVAVDLASNVGPALEETRNNSRIAAEASRDAADASRQAANTSGSNTVLLEESLERLDLERGVERSRLAVSARLKEMKEKAFNLGDTVISSLGLAGAGVLLAAESIETHDTNTPKNQLKTVAATAVFLALMVKAGPEAFRQCCAAGSFVNRLCNSGYQRLQQHI